MINYCNFLITHRCNLNCIHCYQSFEKKTDAAYDNIIYILDMLVTNGISSIQLTGGECTIHERILDIVKYAKSRKLKVGIFTNGQYMPEGLIDVVDSFYFSLDGIDNIHNEIRKNRNAFENTVNSIDDVIKQGKTFSVQITLTNNNLDYIENMLNWFYVRKKSIDSIRLVKAVISGNMITLPFILDNDQLFNKIRSIKELFVSYFHYHVQITDNIYSANIIKNLLLCESKIFPLWIDAVNSSFYLHANKSDFSGNIADYSESTVINMNNELKKRMKKYIETNNNNLISIDDLMAML